MTTITIMLLFFFKFLPQKVTLFEMHDYVDFWGVRNMTLSASKQLVSNELEMIWKEAAVPDQHNILAFVWRV
jgi:hypothetical protein